MEIFKNFTEWRLESSQILWKFSEIQIFLDIHSIKKNIPLKFLQFSESTLFKLINGERNDDKRLSKNAYELKQSNNNSTLTIFCRKTTMNDAYLHSIGLQSGWVAPCQKSAEKMEGITVLQDG